MYRPNSNFNSNSINQLDNPRSRSRQQLQWLVQQAGPDVWASQFRAASAMVVVSGVTLSFDL